MSNSTGLYPLPPVTITGELRENHTRTATVNHPLSDEQKIEKIADHFQAIMETLGLDLNDEGLKGTPKRIATLYVKDWFSGLQVANKPVIPLVEEKHNYNEMRIEKNIPLFSYCEHQFVPMSGKVHVGFFPNGKTTPLSKISRLVNYYTKRPQTLERLTTDIANGLKKALDTEHIAIFIEAAYLYNTDSMSGDKSLTYYYSGKFKNEKNRSEFISFIKA
jgi:GTP cyclohydrolase I